MKFVNFVVTRIEDVRKSDSILTVGMEYTGILNGNSILWTDPISGQDWTFYIGDTCELLLNLPIAKISQEQQMEAFKAIRNHFKGICLLSQKELFICDQICDLFASNNIPSNELYNQFIAIIERIQNSSN